MAGSIKKSHADGIDRIEGQKIVLYDNFGPEPKTIKLIEIRTPHETKHYRLKKTRRGAYLLNK